MKIAVLIYCFDRPLHLSRLLKSIDPSIVTNVFLVQDVPSNSWSKKNNHTKVKNKCLQYERDNINVTYIQRQNHFGLRNNILSGIDTVASKYDFFFVFEDDLFLPNENFRRAVLYIKSLPKIKTRTHFQFLNDQYLELEKDQMSCWGWGIFSESWPSAHSLEVEFNKSGILDVLRFCWKFYHVVPQLFLNVFGIKKTWAVFWSFYIFKHSYKIEKLPFKIVNFGLDGSGTNCKDDRAVFATKIRSFFITKLLWPILFLSILPFRQRLSFGWLQSVPFYKFNSERVSVETSRLGGGNDGGYVIPKSNHLPKKGLLSLGIHDNARFEKDFFLKYPDAKGVLMDGILASSFNFSRLFKNLFRLRFTRISSILWLFLSRDKEQIKLIKKFLRNGPEKNSLKPSISVEQLLSTINIEDYNFLKIDVEGNEYSLVPKLTKIIEFDVILIELHNYSESYRTGLVEELLNWSKYDIYWLSANNYCNKENGVPDVVELGLLRKNLLPAREVNLCGEAGSASFLNDQKGVQFVERFKWF